MYIAIPLPFNWNQAKQFSAELAGARPPGEQNTG